MASQELVFIDTCVWVQFFNRPQSPDKQAVDSLLDDNRAAIMGPILSEVLLGFRNDAQADWVASMLRGLHFLQVNWNEWRSAAQLGRKLAASGKRLPLSDLVIAAVAIERNIHVYTSDPHFDSIPNLNRFLP